MDFRDRRFCQIAPAPGDLQVNLLLAREAAVGLGFGESTPISDWWKIHAGLIFSGGAQIVPRGKMRAAAGEDDDLDRVVLHRAVKGGVEIIGHLQVLRVARFRPVHHDPRDARLRPFHDDGFICGHGCCFLVLAMLTISANDRQETSAATSQGRRRWIDTISVIPGCAPLAQARNPYSRSRLWISGSLVSLAPRNDEIK